MVHIFVGSWNWRRRWWDFLCLCVYFIYFFCLPPTPHCVFVALFTSFSFFPLLLQWRFAAGARSLPVGPQHQQRHRLGPNQLPQRGGDPQHFPRRTAAGRPGPAGLHLLRRPRLPVTVARQQPGPEDARGHGDFQQVHIQVCSQVSSWCKKLRTKSVRRSGSSCFWCVWKQRKKVRKREEQKRKWDKRGKCSKINKQKELKWFSVRTQSEAEWAQKSAEEAEAEFKQAEQRLKGK